MINANDLRMNNLIYIDGRKERVHNISRSFSVTVNGFTEDKLEGIELSPEVLEKCGFEKFVDEGYVWHELRFKNKISTITFTEGDKNGFCEVFIDGLEDVRYRYLHQLQNAVFILTNTELPTT